jgi:hypothetical protein
MRDKQSRIYETLIHSNTKAAFKTHSTIFYAHIDNVSLDASFCIMAHFILTEEELRSNVETSAQKGVTETWEIPSLEITGSHKGLSRDYEYVRHPPCSLCCSSTMSWNAVAYTVVLRWLYKWEFRDCRSGDCSGIPFVFQKCSESDRKTW